MDGEEDESRGHEQNILVLLEGWREDRDACWARPASRRAPRASSLDLRSGRAGAGGVGVLRPSGGRSIAGDHRGGKDDDPLAEVTVVVPSNDVGVAGRRLLASGRLGPVASQGSGSLRQFPDRLPPCGDCSALPGSRYGPPAGLDPGHRRRAADGALGGPGMFAPVAGHPRRRWRWSRPTGSCATVPDARSAWPGPARGRGTSCGSSRWRVGYLEAEFSDEEDLVGAAWTCWPSTRGDCGPRHRDRPPPPALSLHGAALLVALGDCGEVEVFAGTTGMRGPTPRSRIGRRLRATSPLLGRQPLAVVSSSGPGSSLRPTLTTRCGRPCGR